MKRKIYKGFHKILAGIFVLSLVMIYDPGTDTCRCRREKGEENW